MSIGAAQMIWRMLRIIALLDGVMGDHGMREGDLPSVGEPRANIMAFVGFRSNKKLNLPV
jgi:hypothetical protein